MLDEGEFIKFFHRLLERPDLDELFEIASCKYKGDKNKSTGAYKELTPGGVGVNVRVSYFHAESGKILGFYKKE